MQVSVTRRLAISEKSCVECVAFSSSACNVREWHMHVVFVEWFRALT